ncbi:MAG TPA: asparagine synthetase B [Gemmatimonadales bacterium]|nr:asparagine synthetase B [Gemmatimonadales bacterium]
MGAVYGILGDADREELLAMDARLAHRGPESASWSPAPGVHLGIRGGAGSVQSLTGGPLVYDGAVDNRWQLGQRLGRPPAALPTPADDGTLMLELLHRYGTESLELVAGQLAIVWWDAARGSLTLGRDRIGYAPLSFTIDRAGRFIFASEYKALLAVATVDAQPNRDAIQVIQSTKWVKPGATCLVGVYPVAPGTWLEVDSARMHTARFWNIPVRVEHHDEERHAAALRETFLETLRWQTEPYARVGISLSGGLDSAVMAAGARHVIGDKELHTFSAGYGPDDRELVNAEMVARVLGTTHHPIVLRPGDLPGILPWMTWYLEEPIGREDIAYLYVAAREAARHVDVVLAGFGFDGLFAGLPRHRLVDLGLKLPPARRPLEEFYDYTFRSVEPRSLAGRGLRQAYFRGKTFPAPRVIGAHPLPPFVGFPKDKDQPLTNFLRRGFMLNPYQSAIEHLYTAVGVRMNAHHTNPAFLAAAFSIPDDLKIHGRTQKYILRKACSGLLPEKMLAFGKSFNRLKHDTEMSDVLDRMADELLPRDAVLARGLFEPEYIERLRRREGGTPYTQERAYRLWSMLLMEMWSGMYLDRRGAPPEVELPPMRYMNSASMETAGSR